MGSKLFKEKRLSNEEVQKVLDSNDEDTPIKKRPSMSLPDEVQEDNKKSDDNVENQEADAEPRSISRKLSPKELSEIVNQQSPTSTKSDESRKIKIIDALAQPARYAKNRGISASTISRMKETVPAVPSTSRWLSKTKERFPKMPSEPPPDELKKMTMKEIRKEKLGLLAAKEK